MRINLHIYPSPIKSETRIKKETESLINLGLVDRIYILGFWESSLAKEEEVYKAVTIHRIVLRLKNRSNRIVRYFSFFEFLFKVFIHAPKYKATIVNCHSLHVLPLGVWLKLWTGCKLVYDTHELETEVSGSKGILKLFAKLLEMICMRWVDEIIVVSDSIGEWYIKEYKLKHYTAIYNIPNNLNVCSFRTGINLKEILNIPMEERLYIYQGLLSYARGVGAIIEVFRMTNRKNHIVFMGYGPLTELIQRNAQESPNIHYHPAVPSSELLYYTRSADVGIHIIKNTCLNHYYCLPNKIFEYLISGVPFIVSNFPEMRRIADQTGGGWLIEPNMESLLNTINIIDTDSINVKKTNILNTRQNFGWELEEQKLIPVYKRLH